MAIIPHSKPSHGHEEADAVARVITSGHHARGPECEAFEQEIASYLGLKAAHTCASGSAALVLAQRALGLHSGAKILVPSLACAAVAHAVIEAGNEIELYDGGYELPTQGEVDALPEADALILIAPMQGFAGPVPKYAHGTVILDRCQQLSGDGIEGRENAAVEVFSFYATKCISTGSGGALASNNAALVSRAEELNSPDKQDGWRPERFNFGFDDLRASLGRAQLAKLDSFVETRREIATRFAETIGINCDRRGMPFRFLVEGEPDHLEKHFSDAEIDAKRPVFQLLHRSLGLEDAAFPKATEAWMKNFSIPIYPALSEGEIDRICAALASMRA